jgi:hypothetical protein
MIDSVFIKLEFLSLVFSSLVLPVIFIWVLVTRPRIPRKTIVAFGFVLVILAGLDVVLLQRLSDLAKSTVSFSDDVIFASGYTIALYVLPLIGAGLGMNLISHVLHSHIRLEEMRKDDKPHGE